MKALSCHLHLWSTHSGLLLGHMQTAGLQLSWALSRTLVAPSLKNSV